MRMLYLRLVLTVVLTACSAVAVADPISLNTVGDIAFSCRATPQSNLRDVTTASLVTVKAENVSSEHLVAKFRVVITSTGNRTEEFGPVGWKGNFVANGFETHDYTPFSKASTQDEFPKTCQITEIRVCPADPPSTFPKGHYYRPFIDGGKGCKTGGPITLDLAPSPTCTFIVYGNVGGEVARRNGQSVGVAWSHGKGTLEEAKADGYAKLEAAGAERAKNNFALSKFDFEAHFTLVSDCSHQHGAVAAVRKVFSTNQRLADEGVWDGVGGGAADNKTDAEQLAIMGCQKMGKYSVDQGQRCQILTSW